MVAGRCLGGDSVTGSVGKDMGFSSKADGRQAKPSPRPHHHARAVADVTAAERELRDRRPSVRAGRQRPESDWTRLDRMVSNSERGCLESHTRDRRMGWDRLALVWGSD